MKRYLLFALLICPFLLNAQNTTYFMDHMPQTLSFNPAFVPDVDFYLGLPGIGGVSGNAYNSGFNYNELDDFTHNILKTNYNPDDFVESIGDFNHFDAEMQANIFALGLKTKRGGYFSFNITASTIDNLRAASDIAYLLADMDELDDEDFPLEISGIDLQAVSYLTFDFTYSRKINENLTVGISPKLNFNQFGIHTNNIGYVVELEETEFDKNYNQYPLGEVLLGMPTEINPAALSGNELDLGEGLLPDGWTDGASLGDIFRNASFSMDLGATYSLREWTFSASVLNIGASTWKTNSYRLQGNQETIRVNEDKIHIGMPTKVYLGANRQFSPRWNYGLLLHNTFYKSRSVASATLSLNGYVGQALSTSVSYTAGYKYDNFGLGFRLRFLPGADLFMVTDNIIQMFNSKNAYRFSAALGINISVGINDHKSDHESIDSI
jgi:hypothetical protein